MDFKKLKAKLAEFKTKNEDEIKRIKSFFLIIIGYGVLLNYSLLILFGIPFKWYGFPAFGIAYYFIMEELTACIRKIKAPTK
jgi:hypothetical protein